MVVWLIGLSGAGKSTLGSLIYKRISNTHKNTIYLDGDILRNVWGDNLGHDTEGRRTNAHRISHLSAMLDAQGIHVVAAVLSIFPEWQEWNRNNIKDYFEIFLDVPIDVLKYRDNKNLYRDAVSGKIKNVVGIDIPFTPPPKPDLIIEPPLVLESPEKIRDEIFCDRRFKNLIDL